MSQIQPQVDIGQLTFGSLTAFAPILAAITADNVAPMAMIQLEQLGAAFPISGPKAAQVPDCLQRFNSTKLERVGILIGWRKGDTASFMAKSTSGQSIALLVTCLAEIFPDQYGTILHMLSETILSPASAVASPSQLRAGGDVLRAKLACLGFGNVLAKHITRVHDAYQQLQLPVPHDLLYGFSAHTAVDLLQAVSRGLREEHCIVRISGTTCLGYILGLVMMLFPDDAMVSVDNYVIHAGPRRSILIELGRGIVDSPPRIAVEDLLSYSRTVTLPIVSETQQKCVASMKSFLWEGWIANRVRLEFFAKGLQLPEELLVACCSLLVLLPETFEPPPPGSRPISTDLPKGGLIGLLGPYSRERMTQTCQTVLQASPSDAQLTLEEAYTELLKRFESLVSQSSLNRCPRKLQSNQLWKSTGQTCSGNDCEVHALWRAIGWSLIAGLGSFFIVAGPNAVVESNEPVSVMLSSNQIARSLARQPRGDGLVSELECASLYAAIMQTIFPVRGRYDMRGGPKSLAVSSSCTLYPSPLRELRLDLESGVRFELVDGQIQHRKRSYLSISDNRYRYPIRRTSGSLYAAELGGVRPSSCGAHSSLQVSLEAPTADHEDNALHLHIDATYSGEIVPINLGSMIIGSYRVKQAQPCHHPRDRPLSPNLYNDVITTSIAAPGRMRGPAGGPLPIVQVAGNPTAQLLACAPREDAILQKYCCLDCAYQEAIASKATMIIAG